MGLKLKTQGYRKKTQFSSKGEKQIHNSPSGLNIQRFLVFGECKSSCKTSVHDEGYFRSTLYVLYVIATFLLQ